MPNIGGSLARMAVRELNSPLRTLYTSILGRYLRSIGKTPSGEEIERIAPRLIRDDFEPDGPDEVFSKVMAAHYGDRIVDPRADAAFLELPENAPAQQVTRWAQKRGVDLLGEEPTRQAVISALRFNRSTGRNLTSYTENTLDDYIPSTRAFQSTDRDAPFRYGAIESNAPLTPDWGYPTYRSREDVYDPVYDEFGNIVTSKEPHSMTAFMDLRPGHEGYYEHNFPSFSTEVRSEMEPNNIGLHTRGTQYTERRAGNKPNAQVRVIDELQSSWAQDHRTAQQGVIWKRNFGKMMDSLTGSERASLDAKIDRAQQWENNEYGVMLDRHYGGLDDEGGEPGQALATQIQRSASNNDPEGARVYTELREWADSLGLPRDQQGPEAIRNLVKTWDLIGPDGFQTKEIPEPLYPKTQDWTKLALKSELGEAIDKGSTHMAILPGEAYARTMYNKGLEPYYRDIVPSMMDSLFNGETLTSNQYFPRILEISPAMKEIWQRVGFPGGKYKIWSLEEGLAHTRQLAEKAVAELQQFGIPAKLALALVAAASGREVFRAQENQARSEAS